MATTAHPRAALAEGTRFYTAMAFAMSAIIVAGFSANIVMGRSSFSLPLPFHVHGLVFVGWIGLFLAQHVTIATGRFALHARLGQLAYLWIPLMMAAGTMMVVVALRTLGGPFFFDQNEFLVSNLMVLYTFGGLAWWALRVRRHSGWHRRLMLVAMSVLTGPGLGRLLPTPLFMPDAWTKLICLTFLFPLIGMAVDLRRDGRVHPAYWWGMGINVGVFVLSMVLANSGPGIAVTEWLVAGTTGGERPMEAFMPPGFAM